MGGIYVSKSNSISSSDLVTRYRICILNCENFAIHQSRFLDKFWTLVSLILHYFPAGSSTNDSQSGQVQLSLTGAAYILQACVRCLLHLL